MGTRVDVEFRPILELLSQRRCYCYPHCRGVSHHLGLGLLLRTEAEVPVVKAEVSFLPSSFLYLSAMDSAAGVRTSKAAVPGHV